LEAVDEGLEDCIIDGSVGSTLGDGNPWPLEIDVIKGMGRRERRFTITIQEREHEDEEG
jgi:hypothetical protein